MPRLHREACGAPGCSFVAGPSHSLTLVQRLADQCRASHGLSAEPVATFVTRRKTHGKYGMYKDGCRCEPCSDANLAYQRSLWARRQQEAIERRRARDRERKAAATASRRAQTAARLAELATAAWSASA